MDSEQKADELLIQKGFDSTTTPISAFEMIDGILFRYEYTNIAVSKICRMMINRLRRRTECT